MANVEDLILQAYARDPKVVDEDWYLIGAVWKLSGWDDDKTLFENLKHSINPESITRARRKLHEQEKIKYSKDAENRRYEQYKEKTDLYAYYPHADEGYVERADGKKFEIEVDHDTNTVRFL